MHPAAGYSAESSAKRLKTENPDADGNFCEFLTNAEVCEIKSSHLVPFGSERKICGRYRQGAELPIKYIVIPGSISGFQPFIARRDLITPRRLELMRRTLDNEADRDNLRASSAPDGSIKIYRDQTTGDAIRVMIIRSFSEPIPSTSRRAFDIPPPMIKLKVVDIDTGILSDHVAIENLYEYHQSIRFIKDFVSPGATRFRLFFSSIESFPVQKDKFKDESDSKIMIEYPSALMPHNPKINYEFKRYMVTLNKSEKLRLKILGYIVESDIYLVDIIGSVSHESVCRHLTIIFPDEFNEALAKTFSCMSEL